MKTIKVIGHVDSDHRLVAQVPPSVAPGPIEIDVVLPDEDAEGEWVRGIAREWGAELSDPREDIYTLADGNSVDEGR